MQKIRYDISLWNQMDRYLFKDGSHTTLYEILGSHIINQDDIKGVYFALWAPNAKSVSVVGEFNNYQDGVHPLKLRDDGTGVWEGFIPEIGENLKYRYQITTQTDKTIQKSDPVGFLFDKSGDSITVDIDSYDWRDKEWLNRQKFQNQTLSIYEINLNSWLKDANYIKIAKKLAKYLNRLNFTHIKIIPELYPFDYMDSSVSGFFAPSSSFGLPFEFMEFVDILHQHQIGVIINWSLKRLNKISRNFYLFDGSMLYESKEQLFDVSKKEVREFLISSAIFWLKYYHIDGLEVDGVDDLIYLNGYENLEAISFFKQLSSSIYQKNRAAVLISTFSKFPLLTKPLYLGGVGFGYTYNSFWQKDILDYLIKSDKNSYYKLLFNLYYNYQENSIIAISYRDILYHRSFLISKLQENGEINFQALKMLYTYMFVYPGKKLMFMGSEFGELGEWDYSSSLDWSLLKVKEHKEILLLVKDLNTLYKSYPALNYDNQDGFEFLEDFNSQSYIISFFRLYKKEKLLIVCNFSKKALIKSIKLSQKERFIKVFDSNIGLMQRESEAKIFKKDNNYYLVTKINPFSILVFKRVLN